MRGLSNRYRTGLAEYPPWQLGSAEPPPILVEEIQDTDASDWIKQEIRAEAIAVGPASTVADALQRVRFNDLDAAILDMKLSREWSDPVTETLQVRGIPFLFTTGKGRNDRRDRFGATTLSKPYSWEAVEQMLDQFLPVATVPPTP